MKAIKSNIILTVENASSVLTISNINNPEWGIKRFNYNGNMSSFGTGSNSAMIWEHEYKFWKIESFK